MNLPLLATDDIVVSETEYQIKMLEDILLKVDRAHQQIKDLGYNSLDELIEGYNNLLKHIDIKICDNHRLRRIMSEKGIGVNA